MAFNLPFLTRHSITHVVQGEELEFHAISYGMFMALRGVAKPILKAFAILFADKKTDIGQESVTAESPQGDKSNRVSITAAEPDVIKLRSQERTQAIEQLAEGLLGGDSAHVMIELLSDALPDIKEMQGLTKTTRLELAKAMPMETLVEMVEGILKANEKLLAPFQARVDRATTALKNVLVPREPLDESPSEPEQPSMKPTMTASG